MKALHAIWHPACADSFNFRDIHSQRGAGSEVIIVCGSICTSQFWITAQALLHSGHHSGTFEGGDRAGQLWAGRIVKSGKRGAITQAWWRLNHIRFATRTTMGDRVDITRCATELELDSVKICLGWLIQLLIHIRTSNRSDYFAVPR